MKKFYARDEGSLHQSLNNAAEFLSPKLTDFLPNLPSHSPLKTHPDILRMSDLEFVLYSGFRISEHSTAYKPLNPTCIGSGIWNLE
jgi:hypothetical protein